MSLEECIDTLGTWFAIRLSTFDGLDLETTRRMFAAFRYVISEEGDGISTKYHQHIILDYSGTAQEIRQLVKQTYPNCSGNSHIYVKACNDKKQLMKYTLKEGKYCYQGFSKKFIEDSFKCSKQKTDLKKEINANEDNLILGKIDEYDFAETYLRIKVSHDQPIYLNHVRAYLLKQYLKSGHRKYKGLAHNLVDDL